jgi:hypothetical protein
MKRIGPLLLVIVVSGMSCPLTWAVEERPEAIQAIQFYQEHRLLSAMGSFLDVLTKDPGNKEAHAYIQLIAQELTLERREQVDEERMTFLLGASKTLENNRKDSHIINKEISLASATASEFHDEKWHGLCRTAVIEDRLGHLPAANDFIFRVLKEDPRNQEALQILSDLQSEIHQILGGGKARSPIEKATLEGFYAYGQADYPVAVAAWAEARKRIAETVPPNGVHDQVMLLRFAPYETIAQQHVEADQQAQRLEALFKSGVEFFNKQDMNHAFDKFREVAISNPAYPQLGVFLAQTMGAVEKERTRRLSEDHRRFAEEAFANGQSALGEGKYAQAQGFFKKVLEYDPSNTRAREYLAQASAQENRHPDPKAAQEHFEAGLVAFASGDEEGAIREWHIAIRLDPENRQAQAALNKIQREKALAEDLP